MSIRLPVLTPFRGSLYVDTAALEEFMLWHVEKGIEEFWAPGTNGEFSNLSFEEKKKVIETVARLACRHKKRVLAGIHHSGTLRFSVEIGADACVAGANGVFLMTPIYLTASQQELEAYYRNIGEAVRDFAKLRVRVTRQRKRPFSFYMYTNTLSGNEPSLDTIEQLVVDGIISGIKDSSRDKTRLSELIRRFKDKIEVCIGTEKEILWAREQGAAGCVVGLANAFPEMALAAWNGDRDAAARFADISRTLDAFGAMSKKIAAIKYLASQRSGIPLGTRLPMLPATEEDKKILDQILTRYG